MVHSTGPGAVSVTRQKNCTACVQAKRRCDRRTPICKRCADKSIDCVYARAARPVTNHAQQASPSLPAFADVDMTNSLFGGSVCPSYPFSPDPWMGLDYLESMPEDLQTCFSPASLLHPSPLDAASTISPPVGPFSEATGSVIDPGLQQSLVSTDIAPIERTGSPVDEEILTAYDKITPMCTNLEPWMLYDPTTPLYHLMKRVKGFTSSAAERNATPFMHRYLYKDHMPSCIVECFTINVLYTNRSADNMAMVMRALHRKASDLVETEGARATSTVFEKLARTQALFLYQVIRLFDGDVTLRAQGEADIPLLQTWLGELRRIRDNLGNLPESEDGVAVMQAPKEWERWIFAESLRRTVIMAYSAITLYQMMKNAEGPEDRNPWTYTHRWTLSRHLWEADSSLAFFRAWKDKPHYVINNYALEDFLKHGRKDDVDEFAEILLSVYAGVDQTKEFLFGDET